MFLLQIWNKVAVIHVNLLHKETCKTCQWNVPACVMQSRPIKVWLMAIRSILGYPQCLVGLWRIWACLIPSVSVGLWCFPFNEIAIFKETHHISTPYQTLTRGKSSKKNLQLQPIGPMTCMSKWKAHIHTML